MARNDAATVPVRSRQPGPAARAVPSPFFRPSPSGSVHVSESDTTSDTEAHAIGVVRALSLDGPRAANSGHQGTAMALAPLAHVLYSRIMRYDANDPAWPDRDRLILSAGHASILLYSMLYLTGHGLELEDLRQFRQWGSATPGHPEAGHTTGVEVTTGPLGQGLGNGVGMAIAERHLRAQFGADVVDHFTYVIAGDGCLSEGISHEAASLAGHLGLGRLIVCYDDNRITIDGETELALSDDPAKRFEAYGWHVIDLGEASEDLDAMEAALLDAKSDEERPSIVIIRSHIGYPSPSLTDDPAAHGLAFDDDAIVEVKAELGLPTDQQFWAPAEVVSYYRSVGARGGKARSEWQARIDALNPSERQAWDAAWAQTGLPGWEAQLPTFDAGGKVATRKASQATLSALSAAVPSLIGGSADLTGNTGTAVADTTVHTAANPAGRQIYFGVREHAMGAALVGMARHGGTVPFGGTFLVFADYMRPSVRLAALSEAKALFVWTHDSVGVGEDGPTHQPVEQIMSLRAIPGLRVIRPADATETAGAWEVALSSDGPTALILSRQDLPVLETTSREGVAQGAYAVADVAEPQVALIGTGSEVSLCLEAATKLAAEGIEARVVSMPCWDTFDSQPPSVQDQVLPPELPTVSVEAGVTMGWGEYSDLAVGIDRFGVSAPGAEALTGLGMNVDNVCDAVKELLRALDV